MAKKRGKGEGSIFRRASDSRWCGAISAGYREDGRPRRITIYGETRAEVAGKLQELQQQARTGKLAAPSKITVATWLEAWLEKVEIERRANTLDVYSGIAKRYLVPHLGGRVLRALTTRHIDVMLMQLAADGISAKRRADVLRVLGVAMRAAMREIPPLLHANPADAAARPNLDRVDEEVEIPAGGSDVVEYSFRVPSWAKGPLTVSAVLRYRKFNNRYAQWALQESKPPLPIVDLARDAITIPLRIKPEVNEEHR